MLATLPDDELEPLYHATHKDHIKRITDGKSENTKLPEENVGGSASVLVVAMIFWVTPKARSKQKPSKVLYPTQQLLAKQKKP